MTSIAPLLSASRPPPAPPLRPVLVRRSRTPQPASVQAKGAQLGLVQSVPLATDAQDKEDGSGTGAIGDTQSSSAKAMGINVDGQERLKDGPQRIRNAEAGRGAVIGRAWSAAF